MGLPAGQRRALAVIEAELQAAEPRLTAMFAVFTRLTGAKGDPGAESLGTPLARMRQRIKRCLHPQGRRSGTSPVRLRRRLREGPASVVHFAALLPLVLLIALPAVMLGLSRPVRGCQAAPPMHAWATALVYRRPCAPASRRAHRTVDELPVIPIGGK